MVNRLPSVSAQIFASSALARDGHHPILTWHMSYMGRTSLHKMPKIREPGVLRKGHPWKEILGRHSWERKDLIIKGKNRLLGLGKAVSPVGKGCELVCRVPCPQV